MISHDGVSGNTVISCFVHHPCTKMFYDFCERRPCKDCILLKMSGAVCGIEIKSGTFIALLDESEK